MQPNKLLSIARNIFFTQIILYFLFKKWLPNIRFIIFTVLEKSMPLTLE